MYLLFLLKCLADENFYFMMQESNLSVSETCCVHTVLLDSAANRIKIMLAKIK